MLHVAFVLRNEKDQDRVVAQTCRTLWTGIGLTHRKEWLDTNAEGGNVVLDPTERVSEAYIPYTSIVRVVELRQDGRMFPGRFDYSRTEWMANASAER